jgi:hypothetical protein
VRQTICLVVACLALTGPWAIADDEPQYDVSAADAGSLPHMLMLKAKAFAKEHPTSKSAPRAGLDWYVAASAASNEVEASAAKVYLILEHPTSLPGTFIFRSFKDGEELAKCLLTEFERVDRYLTKDFLYKYILALHSAPTHLHGRALSEPSYLLSLMYAHEQTNALPLSQRNGLRKYIGDKNARLFDLIENKDLSAAEKLVQAQEFNDMSTGRAIQRGWFVELWQKEELGPPEYRIQAENMLYEQNWSYALHWLDKIPPETRDSQATFWRGWSLATLGRLDEGKKELEQLVASQKTPDEWTTTAAELAKALEGQKELNEEFTKHLKAIQTQWKQQLPEVVEVRFTVAGEGKEGAEWTDAIDGYVGLDTTHDHFELFVKKNERVMVAFRAKGDTCSHIESRGSSILTYTSGAMIPFFSSRITELGAEKINFNFNFNMKPNRTGLMGESLKALLAPALQSDDEWVTRMMTHVNRQGQFLLPRRSEQLDEFAWLAPQVDKPTSDRFVLRSNDQQIESVTFDKLKVEVVQMGAADRMKLSPPAWPDLPVVNKEKIELPELMAVMTNLTQVFTRLEQQKHAE